MQMEGQVGPALYGDGIIQPVRMGKFGAVINAQLHSRYYEQTYRGNVFSFANQAAVTCGAGLSTTVATVSLSNNLNSGKNLAVLQVSWTFSAAIAAATIVYLVGNYNATTNVTHDATARVIQSGILGSATSGVGKIDVSATLPTAPLAIMPIVGAPGAAGLGPYVGVIDLGGSFIIPPGGYVAIQATAAAVGFGAFVWEENPI